MSVRVALIVGSLRKGAYSRAIGLELKALAAPGLELELVEIGDLPLYNPDLDTETPPPAWTRFRDEVATTEAVLFVTPEYNRSIPGALKNALDVGSRPYGHSVWAKKPAAIVSVSPGALAAFGANHHLRQPLVFLGMPTMQQPEAYIGNVADLLDDDGKLKKDDTKKFLKDFMDAFAAWIDTTKG
ncbi:MAG: NAD(P)H-dependent oxidoreductase [Candidatus Brevundimonas colombiensis]|uniref:NAD(P)H-dependent oxidoreductase n=1 Tax=Candidatus Brevundimonas colombiensis TaxID=3121376 RepID=A0AAJ5X0R4_9CAUL|nr:NAD(P)H-dependent oxidoreductase [Brevundimonas sp.]WEK40330.1 MAG: NAD(P)H-dependent oxidoreductase [Brevundimonas sp.]